MNEYKDKKAKVISCPDNVIYDAIKQGIEAATDYVVALANAIMQICDKSLLSVDCRHRAEELFDKDKCFEKYIELYEKLLNGQKVLTNIK